MDALLPPSACGEMSELMIEQPDGTLCPCTSANAPSAARSVTLDDRTRAALEGNVMDGLFNAFDTQDPLSGFTQVADAGNVMSDGLVETPSSKKAIPMLERPGTYTFLDKPYFTTIPLDAPNAPYASIEDAVKDAAAEIRELARNYYTDYDEIPRNWMLPEVGVVFTKLGQNQYGYEEAFVGNVTVSYENGVCSDEGSTDYKPRTPKFAGRMHFHWQRTKRTSDDWQTALADAAFTAGENESWLAFYEGEEIYFKGKPPRKRHTYDPS